MSNNAILINGSICVSDIIEWFKGGHSAFNRSKKNGKVYLNFTEWINEEKNSIGQHSSILLNSTKDGEAGDLAKFGKKLYIGNGTKSERSGGEIPPDDRKDFDNIPDMSAGAGTGGNQPTGGLPF